jgi:hypothetical protein
MEDEGDGDALMVSSEKEDEGVNDEEKEEEEAAAAAAPLPLLRFASSLLPSLLAVFSMMIGGAYVSLQGKRTSPASPPTASLLPAPSGQRSVTISSYICCLMAGKLFA